MVQKYTRKKSVNLTKNFKSKEFDCKGKSCRCSATRIDSKLVRKLQVLRNWTGKSITINSGNRCPTHNKACGGTSSSYHLNTKGKAADIVVSGMTPEAVAKLAQELGFTGIGCYNGSAGRFVHVDTRSGCYYWRNTAGRNVTVSSHGGTKKSCPHALGTATLRKGSKGASVRALQWVLDWAGYTCKIDGDFGTDTDKMLRSFQKDMGLLADGIAGPQTLAALKEVYA